MFRKSGSTAGGRLSLPRRVSMLRRWSGVGNESRLTDDTVADWNRRESQWWEELGEEHLDVIRNNPTASNNNYSQLQGSIRVEERHSLSIELEEIDESENIEDEISFPSNPGLSFSNLSPSLDHGNRKKSIFNRNKKKVDFDAHKTETSDYIPIDISSLREGSLKNKMRSSPRLAKSLFPNKNKPESETKKPHAEESYIRYESTLGEVAEIKKTPKGKGLFKSRKTTNKAVYDDAMKSHTIDMSNDNEPEIKTRGKFTKRLMSNLRKQKNKKSVFADAMFDTDSEEEMAEPPKKKLSVGGRSAQREEEIAPPVDNENDLRDPVLNPSDVSQVGELIDRRQSRRKSSIRNRIDTNDVRSVKSGNGDFSPMSITSETINFDVWNQLPSSTMHEGLGTPSTPKNNQTPNRLSRQVSTRKSILLMVDENNEEAPEPNLMTDKYTQGDTLKNTENLTCKEKDTREVESIKSSLMKNNDDLNDKNNSQNVIDIRNVSLTKNTTQASDENIPENEILPSVPVRRRSIPVELTSVEHPAIVSLDNDEKNVSQSSVQKETMFDKRRSVRTWLGSQESDEEVAPALSQSEVDKEVYESMMAKRTNPPVRRSVYYERRNSGVVPVAEKLQDQEKIINTTKSAADSSQLSIKGKTKNDSLLNAISMGIDNNEPDVFNYQEQNKNTTKRNNTGVVNETQLTSEEGTKECTLLKNISMVIDNDEENELQAQEQSNKVAKQNESALNNSQFISNITKDQSVLNNISIEGNNDGGDLHDFQEIKNLTLQNEVTESNTQLTPNTSKNLSKSKSISSERNNDADIEEVALLEENNINVHKENETVINKSQLMNTATKNDSLKNICIETNNIERVNDSFKNMTAVPEKNNEDNLHVCDKINEIEDCQPHDNSMEQNSIDNNSSIKHNQEKLDNKSLPEDSVGGNNDDGEVDKELALSISTRDTSSNITLRLSSNNETKQSNEVHENTISNGTEKNLNPSQNSTLLSSNTSSFKMFSTVTNSQLNDTTRNESLSNENSKRDNISKIKNSTLQSSNATSSQLNDTQNESQSTEDSENVNSFNENDDSINDNVGDVNFTNENDEVLQQTENSTQHTFDNSPFKMSSNATGRKKILEEPKVSKDVIQGYLEKLRIQNITKKQKMEAVVSKMLEKNTRIENAFEIGQENLFVPKKKYITKKKTPVFKKPFDIVKSPTIKPYKTPKLYMKEPWITARLYQFVQKRMEPMYGLKTLVRSEKFIKDLAFVVNEVTYGKTDKYNYVITLKKEMARLKLVRSHNDFFNFIRDFLPFHFRIKSIPAFGRDLPELRGGLFEPILKEVE